MYKIYIIIIKNNYTCDSADVGNILLLLSLYYY